LRGVLATMVFLIDFEVHILAVLLDLVRNQHARNSPSNSEYAEFAVHGILWREADGLARRIWEFSYGVQRWESIASLVRVSKVNVW